MAIAKWELAVRKLPNLSERIIQFSATSQVVSHYAKRMAPKTSLGRISPRQYLKDSNNLFSISKALAGFDNSGASNRYSGCGYNGAVPGLYLTTRGKNGVFSSITSESAFYTDKIKYSQLQQTKALQNQVPVSELRQYLDPVSIFSPEKCIVAYESPSRLIWSPQDGLQDLESILQDPLREFMDTLKLVYSDAPDHKKRELLNAAAIEEIRTKGSNSALSLQTALGMPIYTISSAIGNICLDNDIGVIFNSVRSDVLSSPRYMDGAYNIVIPMFDKTPHDLTVSKVYTFDTNTRAIIGQDAYDSIGNPSKIIL